MSVSPLLSVLLTSHADPEEIERLVARFLEFDLPRLELLLVNDTDPAAEPLLQSLESEGSTRVRLFRNRIRLGRAHSLNTALSHAAGNLIWAPRRAEKINNIVLTECLRRASPDPVSFWLLDGTLPSDLQQWLQWLEDGEIPTDERFLFNRNFLQGEALTFHEGLGELTSAELAFRLWQQKGGHSLDAFFVVDRSDQLLPDPEEEQVFLFSLLRSATDKRDRALIIDALQKKEHVGQSTTAEDTLDSIRQLAGQDPKYGLEKLNSYLKRHPKNEEGIKLKITLLERLRRHVEAAELKHNLQKRHGTRPVEQSGVDSRGRSSNQGEEDNRPENRPRQTTLFSVQQSEETREAQQHDAAQQSKPQVRDNPEPADRQEDRNVTVEHAATSTESDERPYEPRLSILIPTTGFGKARLERCLVHLDELVDKQQSELIVIDNASIDDTFDYLESLHAGKFLNLRVITNNRNAGFATSVNQGAELARGQLLLILHNDLLPKKGALQEMQSLLEEIPEIGAVGPILDRTEYPEQSREAVAGESARWISVEAIDSCCMMIRRTSGPVFDESFGLAWYEDLDFCYGLRNKGYEVAIATAAEATHEQPSTTDDMGLTLEPERRWENADIFHSKWDNGPDLSLPDEDHFPDILPRIPIPVNPLNPPGYWLDQIDNLFSDELRTRIHRESLSEKDLIRLIRILVIADKRDFLRSMESRAEKAGMELPADLLESLIRFYYQRNIYSRCLLYLSHANTNGPLFDLYRLRIAVRQKEGVEEAIERLNDLMQQFPCHPDLYRLASEIYLLADNSEEAETFRKLASQIDPENSSNEEIFEIKY